MSTADLPMAHLKPVELLSIMQKTDAFKEELLWTAAKELCRLIDNKDHKLAILGANGLDILSRQVNAPQSVRMLEVCLLTIRKITTISETPADFVFDSARDYSYEALAERSKQIISCNATLIKTVMDSLSSDNEKIVEYSMKILSNFTCKKHPNMDIILEQKPVKTLLKAMTRFIHNDSIVFDTLFIFAHMYHRWSCKKHTEDADVQEHIFPALEPIFHRQIQQFSWKITSVLLCVVVPYNVWALKIYPYCESEHSKCIELGYPLLIFELWKIIIRKRFNNDVPDGIEIGDVDYLLLEVFQLITHLTKKSNYPSILQAFSETPFVFDLFDFYRDQPHKEFILLAIVIALIKHNKCLEIVHALAKSIELKTLLTELLDSPNNTDGGAVKDFALRTLKFLDNPSPEDEPW